MILNLGRFSYHDDGTPGEIAFRLESVTASSFRKPFRGHYLSVQGLKRMTKLKYALVEPCHYNGQWRCATTTALGRIDATAFDAFVKLLYSAN